MEKVAERKAEIEKQQEQAIQHETPNLRARFARYNSPFLQLLIALLTVRYVWQAADGVNPMNFRDLSDPASSPGYQPPAKLTPKQYVLNNFASIGMGLTVLSVIGIYSKRTFDDIKTLYGEAVGYELDKKPKDVTWQDLFVNSKNAALGVTRDAFIKRTIGRAAAGSAFIFPWQIFRGLKSEAPKPEANMNAGVGAMGVYLSLYEGFLRKTSFFDAEQSLMGVAVNHDDVNSHEIIDGKNIQSLLLLQRKHLDKNYVDPPYNSESKQNEKQLATRIADLMNQTYNNSVKTEDAHFSVGKFNYLIGFGLLESFPTNLAFVEMANKSKDMKDVKQAAAAIKAGQDAQSVFQSFGIDIEKLANKDVPAPVTHEPINGNFMASVQPTKDRLPQAPRTHQDFATMVSSPSQMIH